MPKSHAHRLYDRAKQGLERKLYGTVGNVPGRTLTLSEQDFTRAVSSGAGRAGLRRQVGHLGKVDWKGSGRGDDHLLTSGAGRREWQRKREEK